MSDDPKRGDEGGISREEFIRQRPEESEEQGGGAGPDSPETLEPTQGERPGAEDREDDRKR